MLERVLALPAAEQWAIIDNLTVLNSRHDFFVRKPQSARFAIRFDTDDYLPYVPRVRSGTRLAGDANTLVATRPSLEGDVTIPISRAEALLLEQVDGTRTVSEIMSLPLFAKLEPRKRIDFALDAFARMWRSGHLLFGKSGV